MMLFSNLLLQQTFPATTTLAMMTIPTFPKAMVSFISNFSLVTQLSAQCSRNLYGARYAGDWEIDQLKKHINIFISLYFHLKLF